MKILDATISGVSEITIPKKSFNISHYNTILDKNINISDLKEKIEGIFSENFDNFFSDYYPEEIGGEIKTYKSIIKKQDNGFLVLGLDGIEINFSFLENEGLKSINIDFNFPMTELNEKQELYIDTIIGYLKSFGLDLNFKEHIAHKQISCKNGVCNFILNLKQDISNIQGKYEKDILEGLISENWLIIGELSEKIEDEKLKNNLFELKRLKDSAFGKKTDSDEVFRYNNLKLNIIYSLISKQYKQLIYIIDSYISSVDREIKENSTFDKVEGILESDSSLDKSDQVIFLQVKSILEEYKEIYSKKINIISKELVTEKQKKDLLKLGIELGKELPIIIKKIEKEVPLSQEVKDKTQGILPSKSKKEENILNNKKKIIENFGDIKKYIEYKYFGKNHEELIELNYQLFLSGFRYYTPYFENYYCFHNFRYSPYNKVYFVKKEDGLYVENGEEKYKIINIIDGQIVLEINEIEERFGEFIDINRYKIVKVFKFYKIQRKIYDIENNKISESSIGNLTGKYIDINGTRFVQFDNVNHNVNHYVSLDTLKTLTIYVKNHEYWIIDIDDNSIIINGELFFQIKIYKNENIQYLLVNFGDIKSDKNYNKFYEGKIESTELIKFKDNEYYVFKDKNGIKQHINKSTGEILEEKIQEKYNGTLYIKKIIFKDDYIEVYIDGNIKILFDGEEFLKIDGLYVSKLEQFTSGGKQYFNIELLNKNNEVYNMVLNFRKETIRLFRKNNIRLTGKILNFKGDDYWEILLEDKNYFVNLNKITLSYYEEDVLKYKQNGKSYKVIDGVNKGNIIELQLLDEESGEKTYVSLENTYISSENTGKKGFFNKILNLFK